MTAKTWLITGVSSGFGRELATQLLDRGDTVIGTVRRPDSVSDLVQKYPGTFHLEPLDVTATNLTGSIQLIRAALPHLRAQSGGRIIQISSYGGQIAFPGNSMYHATKWGIEGFAESVAQEAAPLRIILGSQALKTTVSVLRDRIAGFEAQAALAASTDFPPGE